jgi:hypothetical protein
MYECRKASNTFDEREIPINLWEGLCRGGNNQFLSQAPSSLGGREVVGYSPEQSPVSQGVTATDSREGTGGDGGVEGPPPTGAGKGSNTNGNTGQICESLFAFPCISYIREAI